MHNLACEMLDRFVVVLVSVGTFNTSNPDDITTSVAAFNVTPIMSD